MKGILTQICSWLTQTDCISSKGLKGGRKQPLSFDPEWNSTVAYNPKKKKLRKADKEKKRPQSYSDPTNGKDPDLSSLKQSGQYLFQEDVFTIYYVISKRVK